MDMNILPPENNVFDKKVLSSKQKDHLIKARAAAKATVERRRKLDAEQKEIEQKPEKSEEPVEEELEEQVDDACVPEQNVNLKVKNKSTPKKKVLSEEEKETHRFQKFMKNMTQWEEFKKDEEERIAESKKIKMSLTAEEYDHIDFLLKRENDMIDKAEADKLESQKPKPPPPKARVLTSQKYINHRNSGNKLNRFGNN